MGHVITFYSFKGGTGRSMALANVGCLLAQRAVSKNGKGVLLIDWDLEAPGLHRYFRDRLLNTSGLRDEKTIDENPGLIDLFRIVDERFKKATLCSNQEMEEWTRQVLENDIDFEPFVLQTEISKLHVMKAGRFDNRYATMVNSFNWNEFYDRAPLFFQVFAQLVSERYDFVCVDSRTGFTDTSGICTTLLPNKLVVVFTPNRQSLTGVTGLIREAASYRRQSTDLRPLLVFPLASRLEPTENTLRQYWRYGSKERGIVGYQGQFEQAFREIYDLSSCSLEDYFNEVLVQHVPSFSYGEDIAVLCEQRGDGLALTRRYECLVEYLLKPSGPWVSRDKNDVAHVAEPQKLPQINLEGTISPYPGLAAFSETEAAFFFGRDIAIDRLLQRLRPLPRLLAFLGPSGSGKTSLIRAGLVPRLRAGVLPSSDCWKILMLPVSESWFRGVGEERSPEFWKDLTNSIEHLLAAEPKYARVLLVIDQCEEIFSESSEAQAQFETQLAKLLSATVPCTVLISLRDVFYSQFTQQFPRVVPWLEEGLVNLPQTLNGEELATIAAEPARAMGVVFEERLLDTIVHDAITAAPGPQASTGSAQTSILPLLQFCLFRLWSTRSEGYISLAAYVSNGSLAGALVNKADEAISVLGTIDAAIARRVLTGLVYQPEDLQGMGFVRRPRLLSDFGSDGESRESITRVVNHLSDYRLVVISVDGDRETVQLAHEAFIRYWPRLRGWLQDDRQILLWTQRILTRAREWNEAGRDAGFLLRGGQLEEAKSYVSTEGQQYSSSLEQEFIQESLKSSRRRRLVLIGAPLIVFLVVTTLAIFAFYLANRARSQARLAEQQRIIAEQQQGIAEKQQRLAQEQQRLAQEQREVAQQKTMEAQILESEAVKQRENAIKAAKDTEIALKAALEARAKAERAMQQDSLNREAINLFQTGKLQESAEKFRGAVNLYRSSGDAAAEALTLQNLAATYYAQGDYAEAKKAIERAIALYEKTQGPESTALANALLNMGDINAAMGNYADAIAVYGRVLDIQDRRLGPSHPQQAFTLEKIGDTLRSMGRTAEAKAAYSRALAIYEKVYGLGSKEVAVGLNNLALVSQSQGQPSEALKYYLRALEINRKVFGTDHPIIAEGLANLAGIYAGIGNTAQAEKLYKEALSILERTSSSGSDPMMVTILNNLGAVYRQMGELRTAEQYIQRALELQRGYSPSMDNEIRRRNLR